MIIPVNRDKHWFLFTLDKKEEKIQIFDSTKKNLEYYEKILEQEFCKIEEFC